MNGDLLKFRVWDSLINEYRKEGTIQLSGNGQPFIINGDMQPEDIDNVIIEQCTGVKDRHGKLIYEGDVVDVYIPIEDAHRKCVVEYVIDGGTAQWICRYLNGSKRLHRTFGESFEITAEYLDGNYSTVIGNIHEVEE